MPVTAEDYQRREELMAAATPAQKPKLRQLLLDYEKSQQPKIEPGQLDLGKPGENVLEAEGHQSPAPETPYEHQDWTNIALPEETPTPAGRTPGTTPAMGEAIRTAEVPSELLDQNLPNASKLRKFQEPPEYTPNDPLRDERIAQRGGWEVVHFAEPPPEQFIADMRPVLQVRGIPENPQDRRFQELYAEYRDKAYSDAYKQAVAEGNPIVRTDYVRQYDKGFGALADYLATKASHKVSAFVAGAMNSIAPGSVGAGIRAFGDPDTQSELNDVEAENPFSSGAGALAGSAAPWGLPALAAGGITRLVGTATPAARLAGAGLAGSAVSAGSLGLNAAAEGEEPADISGQMASGSLLGLGLGLGGQGIAEGAGGIRRLIRGSRIGHELGNFEQAGGATDLLRGLKAPPELESAVESARQPVPGEAKESFAGSPVELRANLLREPLSQANAEALSGTKEAQQRESADFASRYLAGKKVPLRTTLIEAVKELRSRSRADSPAVPGMAQALPGAQNGALRDFVDRAMKPVIVPETQVLGVMAQHGGVASMPIEDAKAMFGPGMLEKALEGVPPDDPRRMLLQDLPAAGGQAPSNAFKVVLVPHDFDANELDGMISVLDHRAGEVNPDPMWDMLRAVARKDREQFGPAWNELKVRQADKLGELEHRSERAGLPTGNPRPYNRLGTNEQVRFDSTLEGAGSTQQKEPSLAALRSLANEAGGENPKNLRLLVGQRSYDALRNSGEQVGIKPVVTSGGSYARLGGLGPAAELRLDALARIISRNPEGLSSVTYAELGPELQAMLQKGKPLPPSAIEHQRPGALTNLFGLGGGGLGIRAAQAYSATGKELLSDDDIATLLAMIRGRQSGQQVAEATQ